MTTWKKFQKDHKGHFIHLGTLLLLRDIQNAAEMEIHPDLEVRIKESAKALVEAMKREGVLPEALK
jgi:hypothetical protein